MHDEPLEWTRIAPTDELSETVEVAHTPDHHENGSLSLVTARAAAAGGVPTIPSANNSYHHHR